MLLPDRTRHGRLHCRPPTRPAGREAAAHTQMLLPARRRGNRPVAGDDPRAGGPQVARLPQSGLRQRAAPRPGDAGARGHRQDARPLAGHAAGAQPPLQRRLPVPLPDGQGDRLVPDAAGPRPAPARALPGEEAAHDAGAQVHPQHSARHEERHLGAAVAALPGRPAHPHRLLVQQPAVPRRRRPLHRARLADGHLQPADQRRRAARHQLAARRAAPRAPAPAARHVLAGVHRVRRQAQRRRRGRPRLQPRPPAGGLPPVAAAGHTAVHRLGRRGARQRVRRAAAARRAQGSARRADILAADHRPVSGRVNVAAAAAAAKPHASNLQRAVPIHCRRRPTSKSCG